MHFFNCSLTQHSAIHFLSGLHSDQYGFKKESQWLSQHDFVIFETYYIPIMERRRQKWAIFMNDSAGELPPRSAKRTHRLFFLLSLFGLLWYCYRKQEEYQICTNIDFFFHSSPPSLTHSQEIHPQGHSTGVERRSKETANWWFYWTGNGVETIGRTEGKKSQAWRGGHMSDPKL